ncbi:MAG: hypothetical protein D3926_00835 [Desulfobacteraceae bacterium]|nr:MAG: hypothetical protein D3926_00835 [Desulfobacteraceae bacterium]
MLDLHQNDVLTRVVRYNLIREGRMIYIDVHQKVQGHLAANFIAVPNLVNIIATPDYQGVGNNEKEAITDCLKKIKGKNIEEIFPKKADHQPDITN